ncbi:MULTISPECIES: hypothetical protein [unclassified Thiocapsa]|uniref:polysaccharide biosynthesis C-terminal domain-containing protein n=1 Tax=unclassified Thiocapsa TaxID=2641286 RepID=UPI0035AD8BEE
MRLALRHPVFVTSAIVARGEEPTIVETIPGWAHDITNIGEEEMIVMLWANEVFDRARPDTVACAVEVAGKIGGRL